MKKPTNSEMATRYIRRMGINQSPREAVRDFAKWLTKEQKKQPKPPQLPFRVELREGCFAEVASQQGRVALALIWDGQACQVIGDKDGIHLGTVRKV